MCITICNNSPKITKGKSFIMSAKSFRRSVECEYHGAVIICLDHGDFSQSELYEHLDEFSPLPIVVLAELKGTGAYQPQPEDFALLTADLIRAGVKFVGSIRSHGVVPVYDALGLTRPPGHPDGARWILERTVLSPENLSILELGS